MDTEKQTNIAEDELFPQGADDTTPLTEVEAQAESAYQQAHEEDKRLGTQGAVPPQDEAPRARPQADVGATRPSEPHASGRRATARWDRLRQRVCGDSILTQTSHVRSSAQKSASEPSRRNGTGASSRQSSAHSPRIATRMP